MRNVALSAVRAALKAEIGFANITNATEDAALNQLIDNKQNWLCTVYDWPFLQHRWNKSIGAGTQTTTFPTTSADNQTRTMNFERPYIAEVLYNDIWTPVCYGIGSEEYNVYDYVTDGGACDPIRKWQFYGTTHTNGVGATSFEVWPVPVTAQTLRFTGQCYPNSLKNAGAYTDTYTLDLDDLLVVYFCAAERLARSDQKDAAIKIELARERLRAVRANYPSRERTVVFGQSSSDEPQTKLVRITSAA